MSVQSQWKDPRSPRSGGGGLTYAQGPHVTYGKNFLGACGCMTEKVAIKLRANCCSSGGRHIYDCACTVSVFVNFNLVIFE